MLGENVHHFGRGIATRYLGRFQDLISQDVHDIVNKTDLVIGNLECSLMPDADRYEAPLSRAIYAAPESALDCFEPWRPPLVLNMANNHFGQHGEAAMAYTVDCLAERGIRCVGQTRNPVELDINGQHVCIWGVSLVRDDHGGGYVKSTAENLLNELDWGEKPKDVLWILSIHWGEEYMTQPSENQQKLACRLAEHGIDLILGHHPHVVQPVRHEAGIPVAYSHGNFLFDQNFSKLTRTGLLLVSSPESGSTQCYLLGSRDFRISTCRPISCKDLEALCRRRMSPYRSLAMRLLMKLEMILAAHEVPWPVWMHFFFQLSAKITRTFKIPALNRPKN